MCFQEYGPQRGRLRGEKMQTLQSPPLVRLRICHPNHGVEIHCSKTEAGQQTDLGNTCTTTVPPWEQNLASCMFTRAQQLEDTQYMNKSMVLNIYTHTHTHPQHSIHRDLGYSIDGVYRLVLRKYWYSLHKI